MATALDTPLIAYPTLSTTAEMLGVSVSTLSRRGDLAYEAMGDRDKRITAAEVLRLAAIYRKRSINEVASDALHYAREHAPEHLDKIEEEIETFFESLAPPRKTQDEFLTMAERALPAKLYSEVERVYRAGAAGKPADITAA